jgi:hypothetical protein
MLAWRHASIRGGAEPDVAWFSTGEWEERFLTAYASARPGKSSRKQAHELHRDTKATARAVNLSKAGSPRWGTALLQPR